jgi:MFS family permease
LYMQLVLGYGPMQVALAFLPANVITAVFALGLSAELVTRFGLRKPLSIGLLLIAASLALFARVPVDATVLKDILPGMILFGLGAGIAYNPLVLAAMGDVAPTEFGLASGVVNTASSMGGALGLAILASVAAARTNTLLASGTTNPNALMGGYRAAFLLGAVCAGIASVLGAAFLRAKVEAPMIKHINIGAVVANAGIDRQSGGTPEGLLPRPPA